MAQGAEARILPELGPGESLLWSGRPHRGFMFHPVSLLLIVMLVFVFALVGGLIMVNNTLHFVKVIEHLTSGASARVFFIYLVSGFFILLGLVALWSFVFYPLERRKTAYALTSHRAIIISGLFRPRAKSFDLKTLNFTALSRPVKDKATIVFGEVDPDQYGAADPAQKLAEIKTWKRLGYTFELFEVGVRSSARSSSPRRPVLGRFEFIEDPRTIYGMLRSAVVIHPPEPAEGEETPKVASVAESAVKTPGIIMFIIDISASMLGTKLDQAKQGLIGALSMVDANMVGLISFNDQIVDTVPVAPLTRNRRILTEKVTQMSASGSTALYDAIKAGIEMTDRAAGGEKDICTLVVSTDGQANEGKTQLHDILKMTTRDGKVIRQCSDLNSFTDNAGRMVSKVDIKGIGLAMPTRHPVQIFFLGIGDDADMEIGRILAEATGADYEKTGELPGSPAVPRVRRVRELDLARVLEEFKYF